MIYSEKILIDDRRDQAMVESLNAHGHHQFIVIYDVCSCMIFYKVDRRAYLKKRLTLKKKYLAFF